MKLVSFEQYKATLVICRSLWKYKKLFQEDNYFVSSVKAIIHMMTAEPVRSMRTAKEFINYVSKNAPRPQA